jgi:hypothetical protein
MLLNILLLIGGSATLATIGLAIGLCGLGRARRALRETAQLHEDLKAAELRLAAAIRESAGHLQGLSDRLQQMAILQRRLDGTDNRQGLREAIALTRNGARPEQLVENCGIAEGEARLIQTLYGRDHSSADRAAAGMY